MDENENAIPVWGVKVCPALAVEPGANEETATPIATEDWKPDQYHFPSRPARFHLPETDESINFGTVEDLPKKKREQGQPPKGSRVVDGKGGVEEKYAEDGLKYRRPYYPGPDDEIIRVRSKKGTDGIVELNERHKFVRQYFRPGEGFVVNSKVHKLTILLFRALAALALSVALEYRKKKLVDPQKDDVEVEYLNAVVSLQIAQCPLIEDLCKRINKC
jgi:hypothetical protein